MPMLLVVTQTKTKTLRRTRNGFRPRGNSSKSNNRSNKIRLGQIVGKKKILKTNNNQTINPPTKTTSMTSGLSTIKMLTTTITTITINN